MKNAELIKLLKSAGCYIKRHGANHDIWFSPTTGNSFTVERHRREVAVGTANSILKDAGIK